MPVKPKLPAKTKARARVLRRKLTDAEARLWLHLRAGELVGHKFRRQHPILPYIVDFYCDAAKLVVEVDGSQHTEESDRVRTEALQRLGLKVVRYWDNEVLQQTEAVLNDILRAAEERTLTPAPLPEGEGDIKERRQR
jgi:very-short-patch-repair endonuclease